MLFPCCSSSKCNVVFGGRRWKSYVYSHRPTGERSVSLGEALGEGGGISPG